MELEVLWRQLVGTGAEHLVLTINNEIRADSLSVGEIESTAYRIHYEIDCNHSWSVQHVRVQDLLGRKTVALQHGPADRWSDADGHVVSQLNGCTDVDLMITPFTNTLPIRRLNLRLGESRELSVAYIGLPGLQLSRMQQRYTCLLQDENGGTYRYESLQSGFTAELKVDTDGLVVDYPNIFEMDAKRPLSTGRISS